MSLHCVVAQQEQKLGCYAIHMVLDISIASYSAECLSPCPFVTCGGEEDKANYVCGTFICASVL